MKQFLSLPILFLILPEVKQFFFCNTRCPNDYPLLCQRLGVNQKLLFHGRNLILHKILIISPVYWFTLEGMLIFTSLFDRYCFITFTVLDSLRTLYVYAQIIPLKNFLLLQENFRHTTLKL